MKKLLFSTAIIFLLLPVKIYAQKTVEKKGWPSWERSAFIIECIKSAKAGMSEDSARSYCYCMQFKVEAKYPTIEAAGKITEADMESPEWKKDIKNCLSAGSWSSKDHTDFLSDCIGSAKERMGEEKATAYCKCMLSKVESKYPNPTNAGNLSKEKLNSPEWKKIIKECLDF